MLLTFAVLLILDLSRKFIGFCELHVSQNANRVAKRKMNDVSKNLIKLLQRAYSGEMAAALAYRGHQRILRCKAERKAVRQIELDEWQHRREIGKILAEMGAKPLFFREILFFLIGRSISFFCFFAGRFIATYFAGKLESGNVREYQEMFELAKFLGFRGFCRDFTEMRETESRHERILFEMVVNHRLLPYFAFVFGWGKTAGFVTESRDVKF